MRRFFIKGDIATFDKTSWIIVETVHTEGELQIFAYRAAVVFGMGVHWGGQQTFVFSMKKKPESEPVAMINIDEAAYQTFDEWVGSSPVADNDYLSIKMMCLAWDAARIKK